jgi:hypothetical protein
MGNQTFMKRQKEAARREKKQKKAARMAERRSKRSQAKTETGGEIPITAPSVRFE